MARTEIFNPRGETAKAAPCAAHVPLPCFAVPVPRISAACESVALFFSLVLAFGCLLAPLARSQEDVPAEKPVAEGEAAVILQESQAVDALASIIETISTVETDLKKASAAAAQKGIPDTEKQRLEGEVADFNAKLEKLRADFAAIASGVAPGDAPGSGGTEKLDLGEEFNDLLLPIIAELKEATRQPREVEQLRSDLRDAEHRFEIVSNGLENVNAMIGKAGKNADLVTSLRKERDRWAALAKEAEGQVKVIRFQLDEVNRRKRSFIDTATEGTKTFFRTRGKNLLLTFLTFGVVFAGLRLLYRYLLRVSPWHRGEKRPFHARLIDIVYNIFSLVGAFVAAILVLYATGDWVLLGLSLILLFGLLLAAKNGLPKYYQQARLILNLGEVREGERIVYEGVPYAVKSLGLFSTLQNKALQGGIVRIPVGMLVGQISRHPDPDELWFPSHVNDWVRLSDGTTGKVLRQTPEFVQLVLLGGSRKSYLTPDFLALVPENLSGGFRLRTTFGIDYAHQADCTGAIPETLWKEITRELLSTIDREQLHSLKVEFASAGASSLDFDVIADLSGDCASKTDQLGRLLQRACVNSCNTHGWVIPFTQITLHQAAATK